MKEADLRTQWEALLRARIEPLLRSIGDGDDAPPALRFKAEGCAETGLALGLVDAQELAVLLDAIYADVSGVTIADYCGYPASECIDARNGRVALPFLMPRAPVFPTSLETRRGD